MKSGGMIIAASTAPERTFSRASARLSTGTVSIAFSSSPVYVRMLIF